MLISDDNIKGSMLTPETPKHLPLDLQYASLESAECIQISRSKRMNRAQRLEELIERSEIWDKAILDRMSDSVKVTAANTRLGLLTVLAFILRWPDWQMTRLYTKGVKVAGIVGPSIINPCQIQSGDFPDHTLGQRGR